MGIDDRWRHTAPGWSSSAARVSVYTLVAAIIGGVLIAAIAGRAAAGTTPVYGGEMRTHSGATKISLLGLGGITIAGDSLYRADDPWKVYLAPERACPGGDRVDLPLARQADIMVCLVNYARRKRGVEPADLVELLNRTSIMKANKIDRCRDFRHDACGADAAADARAAGYTGPWGENLFIAEGVRGAPRPSLDGWLNSTAHRENLFRPDWSSQGIAVTKIARFGRERDVTVWVSQFGAG